MSVRDAIYALVTKSANDVATAIAEAMAGGEKNFARLMTAEARKLGMSRTTFRNSSGLPHRAQMSTARDMATLARALLTRYAHFYHYFATRHFTFDGVTHKNHNDLLSTYEGMDGLKTGYIRASGFNLVTSVKRGDYRVIGVVFGGRSPRARNRHMVRILDKGFELLGEAGTARAETVRRENVERLATAPVTVKPRRARPGGGWVSRSAPISPKRPPTSPPKGGGARPRLPRRRHHPGDSPQAARAPDGLSGTHPGHRQERGLPGLPHPQAPQDALHGTAHEAGHQGGRRPRLERFPLRCNQRLPAGRGPARVE